ncbi:chemotaxis protein CheW [Horticoccus luteus]|uniref:Chemotaxis protein CheW n=1 Tax=Horticoccus luteus TaxID=2862869 RepID=A0A8F9XII6_9BACT|nr:chemotaxis protein CheW [Horticoccus luteus]QYM80440.1 chemotaxis protein CheW [Horticoccus luteus]
MLFLLFQLGNDRYALAARDVVEVLPLLTLKAVPGAPRGVAGLMDYRGTAVPVIDLSALVIGRPAAQRISTRLLLARYTPRSGEERLLALMAERATEMLRRDPADFQPAGVQGEDARYLGPVLSDSNGLIQRVDVNALLSDEVQTALYPAEGEVTSR